MWLDWAPFSIVFTIGVFLKPTVSLIRYTILQNYIIVWGSTGVFKNRFNCISSTIIINIYISIWWSRKENIDFHEKEIFPPSETSCDTSFRFFRVIVASKVSYVRKLWRGRKKLGQNDNWISISETCDEAERY